MSNMTQSQHRPLARRGFVQRMALAGGGLTLAGPAACARAETATPIVNVKTFGAKGDSSTDDSAAIQAALDAGRDGKAEVTDLGGAVRSQPYIPWLQVPVNDAVRVGELQTFSDLPGYAYGFLNRQPVITGVF